MSVFGLVFVITSEVVRGFNKGIHKDIVKKWGYFKFCRFLWIR